MADKTTKKTTVKKTAATRAVSKPAVAKKTAVKKAPVKKATATKKVAVAPVVEKYPCGCDKGCACGGECMCAKKKCTFGRFLKKLVLVLIVFALGFASAKMCCCDKRGKFAPKPEFNDQGCLVVKCQKMAEKIPFMDLNHDGCVTRDEFKATRKHMKRKTRPEMPEGPAM